MTAEVERRYTPGQVETRAGSDKRTIGGYAAKFNRASQNLGGFVEVVAPSAFNRSKGNGWPGVMARYNHDDNRLLGTTSARTLRLSVDDVGLVYDVDPPKSREDVYELVQRGDVAKSSFAFRVIGSDGEEWGLSEQNFPQRTLLSVDLVDVAPVNTPAYVDTETGLRSSVITDVALRHLAGAKHADPTEVRKLAESGKLDQLFRRTDKGAGVPGQKAVFGPAALAALQERKTDPYATS